MKQIRWIIILAVAAVLLTVAFLFVNQRTKEKEKQEKAGEAKQLFSVDSDLVTRISIDSKDEGNFTFEWSDEGQTWVLGKGQDFNLNVYAVQAICNNFCTLWSEKTVAFNCKDTKQYGFENPVTVKVYTTETGDENPYTLYVGDNTPTYDSYYAMVEGHDDVYTISYTSGSVFCVAKNTLKNLYIFDTSTSLVTYMKQEEADGSVIEVERDKARQWQIKTPKLLQEPDRSAIENVIDAVIRVTVSAYLADDPENLAMYGLDHPQFKMTLRGVTSDAAGTPMEEEIWFGKNVSENPDETEMYGYFAKSNQVFKILRADVAAIRQPLSAYLSPFCTTVSIADLKSIDIDLGDVLDLKTTFEVNYEEDTFRIDGKEITRESDLDLAQNFYRSVTMLQFSDIDLKAKPENDPAMRIVYHFNDGTDRELGFVQFADNNFYLMRDGAYTGLTVRLNRFTSVNSITKNYDALIKGMAE